MATVNTLSSVNTMGRPKLLVSRKQITFSLSEADYKWIELQSNGNVSKWCRERILSGAELPKAGKAERFGRKQAIGQPTEIPGNPSAEMPTAPLPEFISTNCQECSHDRSKHYQLSRSCQAKFCNCMRFVAEDGK